MRLLIVACILQLSGSSHVLVSTLYGSAAACIELCEDPCQDGQDDHDCLPGCLSCDCPHGRLPALPPALDPALPARVAWDTPELTTPYRSGAPPSPPPSSLERPPRV